MKKVITTTLAVVITLAFVSCNDNGIGNSKGGPADRFVESFINYTLTVNRNPTAGGTVSPSGSSTRSGGSSVTVSATAASGYTFTGWSGASTSTNPSVSITMNGNRTLTANFTRNAPTTYTLTVNRNPTAGGTVSPSGSSTHNAGSSVTVSATAASGYTFTGWSGASTSTSSSVSITMNGDRTLTANFVQNAPTSYTLTVNRNPTAGGTVSPSGTSTHNAGSSVTVSATAASGYTFTGWSGASTSTSSSVSITMNGDRTLTANFQLLSLTPGGQFNPNITYGSFIDSRDNQTYRTVTIGTQTWMAENLNWAGDNGNLGACYNNNTSNCDLYGRLYNWNTVMGGSPSSSSSPSGVRGVCPAGWHVPSDAEWTTLTNFVGSNAGAKLRSRSGWHTGSGHVPGTDDFGFSALPGGYGWSGGFFNAGRYGYWWSATEYDAGNAWGRNVNWGNSYVGRYYGGKTILFSVRCLRD